MTIAIRGDTPQRTVESRYRIHMIGFTQLSVEVTLTSVEIHVAEDLDGRALNADVVVPTERERPLLRNVQAGCRWVARIPA